MHVARIHRAVPAAALVLAAGMALAGCSDLVSGSSAPVGSAPVTSPPAVVSAAPKPAGAAGVLLDRLVSAPHGSRPWSGSWGHTERPTTARFLREFYRPAERRQMAATLHARHLVDIAHRSWVAADGNQIDLVLMRFASPSGAATRYAEVTTATAAQPGMTAFPFGAYGRDEARGFVEAGRDSDGFARARGYAHPARSVLLLEAFYFSPHRLARADLLAWTEAQVARMD